MCGVYKIPPNQILMLFLMSLLCSPCDKDIFISFLFISLLSLSLSASLLRTPSKPSQNKQNYPKCNSSSHFQSLTVDTALLYFMETIPTVLYVSAQTCLHLGSLKRCTPFAFLPHPSCKQVLSFCTPIYLTT